MGQISGDLPHPTTSSWRWYSSLSGINGLGHVSPTILRRWITSFALQFGLVFQDPPGAQTHFGKHKGFGLAFICELLAGALTGAWSAQPGNERQGTVVNHMLTFILNPEVVGNSETFASETLALIEWVKSSPAAKGVDSVLIPGEPERIAKADRQANGIDIDEVSWEGLLQTAEAVDVNRLQVEQIFL